jgi:hypothetical protein
MVTKAKSRLAAEAAKPATRAAAQKKNESKVKPSPTEVVDQETGEVRSAPAGAITPITSVLGNFRLKRRVTVPSLVIKGLGSKAIVTINSAIDDSKVKDPKKPNEKPARVCDAFNHLDGRDYKFLVPTVVEKNLEMEYPDGGYVGKTFAIQHLGKRAEGQRYNDFEVAEVEAA